MSKLIGKCLKSGKELIWTGDLNAALQDFDVYDGETNKNRKKSAGFTPYERTNLGSMILDHKLSDVYREAYPQDKENCMTFWSFRSGGRKKNRGWRLDYYLVTAKLLEQ